MITVPIASAVSLVLAGFFLGMTVGLRRWRKKLQGAIADLERSNEELQETKRKLTANYALMVGQGQVSSWSEN